MANAKISDSAVFKTDVTDVLDIDGFAAYSTSSSTGNAAMSGTQLVASLETRINLSNMSSGTLPADRGGTGITNFSLADFANDQVDYSSDGTGILPFAKGGTGVSSLSGSGFVTTSGSAFNVTSSINLASSDVSNVLSADKGGTGVAGTAGQKVWNAVQQFVWTDGSPIAYTSITNNTGVYLPFDTNAVIDVSTSTSLGNKWTAVNSAQGVGGLSQQCTFTLGVNGGGTWRIEAMIPMFDFDDFTTGRLALDIDGTEIAIFEHSWQAGRTGVSAQSLYGNLTYTFSGQENVKLLFYGDGSGSGFYPAGNNVQPFFNNRPPEITFTRVV